MLRLHCILHACPVPWLDDRNWALVCLIGLHFIWHENCTLDSLGHHAWKCVIGGPRIEAHAPLSHYHDKGHEWCIHALNCAAMLCLALCCCELLVLQAFFVDRQYILSTGSKSPADEFILCRWSKFTAGGHSIQPVALPNVQGRSPEVLAASRGVKEGKQGQPMHGGAYPKAIYCFLSLVKFA